MYKYTRIAQEQEDVNDYINDLETLLSWLVDYGVLDNLDGKNGFVDIGNGTWEWRCGDRSIELSDFQVDALDRLGLLFK